MIWAETKKGRLPLLLLFLLALALRIAYAIFLKENYLFYDYPSDDVLYYRQWAQEIASGNWIGKRVFYGMPLYPYFLAILERISFGHFLIVRLAHFILGSMNVVLVYCFTERAFSRKAAYLASFLAATNFVLIYYDWLMVPVTLIIFIGLVIVLALLNLNLASRKGHWFALGLVFGFGMLADGKFAIVLVLVLAYLMHIHLNLIPQLLRRALLPLAAGVLLVLSVVAVRNRVVGGDWVLVSAHGGINFYIGNNPEANGAFVNPAFLRPSHYGHEEDPRIIAQQILNKELTPAQVSQYWFLRGLSYVSGSPLQFIKLLGRKFYLFFTDSNVADDLDLLLQTAFKTKLNINSFRIIIPFAILGAIIVFRRRRETFILSVFIVGQLLFSLAFFVITRHRVTILPFAVIYEAVGILWLGDQIRLKNYGKAISVSLALILLFFLFQPVSVRPNEIDYLRYTKAGSVYSEQKKYRKAEEQFLKALELAPAQPSVLYNLGLLYLNDGRYVQAQKYFEKAVAIRPYEANAVYNLALSYERTGDWMRAISSYQRVLQLQPGSKDARDQLGKIYYLQGRMREAEQLLK